jgi:hypothetical protein
VNLRRWFAQRSLASRAVLVVAAAIVAVNAALYAARLVAGGSEPGGSAASAHATAPDGFAGWADLLRRSGKRVVLLDQHLADSRLPAGSTVVVAQPEGFTADDAHALAKLLGNGGRVVLVGSSSATLLESTGVPSIRWVPSSSGRPGVLAPVPEVRSVTAVSGGGGRFRATGPLLPVLGSGGDALAAVGEVGSGRVVAVASTEVFDNAHLADFDNAAFAVDVAGAAGATVYFDEADHGYGPAGGFSALPSGWRWAAAGLLVAVLAGLWSRGRRFGPAEDRERPLAPPRRLHVEALAAALARARDVPGAGGRLWGSVRRQLARSTGITPDDPRFPAAARDRAAVAGTPEPELDAIAEAPRDQAELLALGSVAARLSRASGERTPPGGSL